MTIAEIIELENSRKSPDMYGRIHLLREGNFYRAHDWSAWMAMTNPINDLWPSMSIIARKLKDGYIDVFIGFPLTSLEKYIPNDGSVTFVPIGNNQIDVVIMPTDDVLAADFDTIRKAVDEWKAAQPISENKSSRRENREASEAQPRIIRFSDVIHTVISFPLESKSPMEAYEFLRQLRRDVIALF